MSSVDNDISTQVTKRSPEVEGLLNELKDKEPKVTEFEYAELNDLVPKPKLIYRDRADMRETNRSRGSTPKTMSRSMRSRPSSRQKSLSEFGGDNQQPKSFEPIAIRSDNHHADPNEGSFGLMLVEAALLPNLSYVGVRAQTAPAVSSSSLSSSSLVQQPASFFYPNGKKSKFMRQSIQESLRKVHEDCLNPPKQKSNNDSVKIGKSLEKSYSLVLEKEISKKRNLHLKTITQSTGRPLRTSLVDRPATAASTSSVMKDRGKVLDRDFIPSLSLSSSSSTGSSSFTSPTDSLARRPFTTGTAGIRKNMDNSYSDHQNNSNLSNSNRERGRITSKESAVTSSSSRPSPTSSTTSSATRDVHKMNNADLKRYLKSKSGRLEIAMMQQHPSHHFY